jgi:hypothetical protein
MTSNVSRHGRYVECACVCVCAREREKERAREIRCTLKLVEVTELGQLFNYQTYVILH